jgi:ferrous iron transport protein A
MAVATTSELRLIPRAAEPATAAGETSLAALGPGSVAVIVDIDRASPEGQRLLDLGFVPNTRIEVLKRAPLGDPMVYDLRGYRLCLRRTDADRVRVMPV